MGKYFAIFFIIYILPGFSNAVADSTDKFGTDLLNKKEFWDVFEIEFHNLYFAMMQDPSDSFINPNNNFFEIPRYTLQTDFRPDFSIKFSKLQFNVKPRLELSWSHWEDGSKKGESDKDSDLFVNEWTAGIKPFSSLFISYGREDLQWGPSLLLSPSNPFYTYNGRSRPKIEVAGSDYGRIVWTPDMSWSLSFIANTDEGRKKLMKKFHKTYAVKLDYLKKSIYSSLILSHQETKQTRIGELITWNTNDALRIYQEGSFTDDTMESLFGISYTYNSNNIFSMEYFYNSKGISDNNPLLPFVILNSFDNRDSLFRKKYLLAQYYYYDVFNDFNFLLRYTQNLDDESFIILSHFEYNFADHFQLFLTGDIYNGNKKSEFGSMLHYRALIGIEIFFNS